VESKSTNGEIRKLINNGLRPIMRLYTEKSPAEVKYNLYISFGPKRLGTGESIVGFAKNFGA